MRIRNQTLAGELTGIVIVGQVGSLCSRHVRCHRPDERINFFIPHWLKGADMTRTSPAVESQTDDLQRQFLYQLNRLQKSISAACETAAIEAWHETCKVVEALPLATDQYDRAMSRLGNCKRYLISSEYGAAVYELKLLVGTVELRKAEVPKAIRHSSRRQTPVVFEPIDEVFAWQ